MHHGGLLGANNLPGNSSKREVQVAVFPPGSLKALVEAADRFQRIAAAKTIRGDELRTLQAGGVLLIIRRSLGNGTRTLPLTANTSGSAVNWANPALSQPLSGTQSSSVNAIIAPRARRQPALRAACRSLRAKHGNVCDLWPAPCSRRPTLGGAFPRWRRRRRRRSR